MLHWATGVWGGVAVGVAVGVPVGVPDGVAVGVALGVPVASVKSRIQVDAIAGGAVGISCAAGLLDGLIGEMEVCLNW